MLVNMENNIGLNLNIDGFSFEGPYTIDESKNLIRQGTYRFSIRDNRQKR